jgi:hypothetical protein
VKLVALGASLDKLEPSGTLFLKKVVTAVKNVFQEDVGKVVAKDEFQTTLKGLKDSVVAIKFIQVGDRLPRAFTRGASDWDLGRARSAP